MRLPKRIKPKYKDAMQRTVIDTGERAVREGSRPAPTPTSQPTIRALTNRDPEFYSLLGPFLANRTVNKELGGPPWDDPGKRWYVAIGPAGDLLGFAAVIVERASITFCSAWVRPEKRCGGVYAALLAARVQDYGTHAIRARATRLSRAALEACGFQVEREVGQYFEMVRNATAPRSQ